MVPDNTRTAMVTGAKGLLGQALTLRLRSKGWRVVAFGHSELDITREEDIARAFEINLPDVVFNCAATADVDRCEREPEWAFAVNERGPRLLASAAARAGAEIVHVSTDYVFDGKKEGYYSQEDSPGPLSVYGDSKLAGELAVAEATGRSYIMRTSWIFGAGGKNFGSRVVEYARGGDRLKAVTDQTSIPTYAPDLAARIVDVVDLGRHGLYHVTNSVKGTWYEFSKLALELAGLGRVEIEPVTRADLNQLAPRPGNSAMRCLLSQQLGFDPMRNWRDCLPDFIAQL